MTKEQKLKRLNNLRAQLSFLIFLKIQLNIVIAKLGIQIFCQVYNQNTSKFDSIDLNLKNIIFVLISIFGFKVSDNILKIAIDDADFDLSELKNEMKCNHLSDESNKTKRL